MPEEDENRYQYLTYRHIATTAGTVVGCIVALTFFGFVIHDCNASDVKLAPERAKQTQEIQKLQSLCLESSCPEGQYRVFKNYQQQRTPEFTCTCDSKLFK